MNCVSYIEEFEKTLQGLQPKTGRQAYNLGNEVSGALVNGTNVYGILRAPRGDATEAIVISTSWRTIGGQVDIGGVALLMSLAGYFQRTYPVRQFFSFNRLVALVKRSHFSPNRRTFSRYIALA